MTIIKQMINNYDLMSLTDRKNAIKEIIQEIALAALSKTDFFKHAAFYGGTALRIFYDLDRFSEDLDFTLMTKDESFDLSNYFNVINEIAESLGLRFEITSKKKSVDSQIKSAFLKTNTKEQFLNFYPDSDDFKLVATNEKIQIKFEIDTNPPKHAKTEIKYRLLPFPYQVNLYDKPSLFAGKIHAVLARGWKNRIKGRDLYDYIFYLATNTKVNLKHLESRLKQTNSIKDTDVLTLNHLKDLLNNHFKTIDFDEAKHDVLPFIKDISSLDLWDSKFFISITENLKAI